MAGTRTLSVGQQTLWTLHRLAPESAADNDAGAVRLDPAPAAAILSRAVDAVVARHDMLRSVFVPVDGRARRVVDDHGRARLEVHDVGPMADRALAEQVLRRAREPYRLDRSGPFRAVLFRRPDDAVLLLGTHRIAADLTSQAVLWRDLRQAYLAGVAGREPGWARPATDYDEYVARERVLLDSPRGARMSGYWRGVCAGTIPAELPTDRDRPLWPAYRAATHTVPLPYQLAARVRVAAAHAGVSPFGYLLGAFQALLYRFTAVEDFSVVSPATTRRRGARDVIGDFSTLLVLRARFGRGTTLDEAVRSAGEQVRQGIAHAAFPHPYRWMAPDLDAPPDPPPRIAVTLVTADRFSSPLDRTFTGEVVESAGQRMSRLDVPRLESRCDLALEITEGVTALSVAFRYDTELFDGTTIERLSGRYLRLVALAVTDPATTVARIRFTGKGSRCDTSSPSTI